MVVVASYPLKVTPYSSHLHFCYPALKCRAKNHPFAPFSQCFVRISGRIAVMAPPTGAHIIARSLRDFGVTVVFGIVGIPVVEIAEEAINLGIRFIGFRNEQAASYAASAYGYLTGRPGVCLVVGGPGVLHGLAGVCILMDSCQCDYIPSSRISIASLRAFLD